MVAWQYYGMLLSEACVTLHLTPPSGSQYGCLLASQPSPGLAACSQARCRRLSPFPSSQITLKLWEGMHADPTGVQKGRLAADPEGLRGLQQWRYGSVPRGQEVLHRKSHEPGGVGCDDRVEGSVAGT